MGIVIPPHISMRFTAVLGWCAKAVDAMADRLVFRGFGNDEFLMNEIFNANNPDILFDSAILTALIGSCAFVYINKEPDNFIPKMQVIDPANATGIIDPTTGFLTEGYAVLDRDQDGKVTKEAYFTAGKTEILEEGKSYTITHGAPAPALVPVIHRPDAVRPFGRSRITRSAMYYQAYAKRTMERADISAEFYSFPQKYVVGLSQDAEPMDKWKATVSSLLEFTKDVDGDSPKLGQFNQVSMSPFVEQLRVAAAGFAGETGLTLDDLGFVTDNPSSAEAIKASHEGLRVATRKAQRTLGSGFLNVGFIAACIRDDFAYTREDLTDTIPKWEPVFEADASSMSLIGDGVIKLNQAIPGYINSETLRDLTGIKGADVDE